MPDVAEAAVLRELEGRRLGFGRKLQIVVAGSWHVGEPDLRNVSRIYDGRGKHLLDYHKRDKFKLGDSLEAIAPGNSIAVLVMEDRLVAVGICLDFCNELARPYSRLDCDLIVVPSMGERTTIDAHLAAAKSAQTIHDTVAFVVQQTPVILGEELKADESEGYSMARPAQKTAELPDPPDVRQSEPFRTLQARR